MIMRRIIAGIRIKENKISVIQLKKKMIIQRLDTFLLNLIFARGDSLLH